MLKCTLRARKDRRGPSRTGGWTLALLAVVSGCLGPGPGASWIDPELEHYKSAALQIDYPDVESEPTESVISLPEPITLSEVPSEYWEMPLKEAIGMALSHSSVLRDLGGLILQAPDSAATRFDPALADTDPRTGVEAALSAFDASFESGLYFEKNDRALNNVFFGGGTRQLVQDLHSYQVELAKTAATGGTFALRKIIDYDFNNSPGNADPNLPWTAQLEGEFRQPLLQGAGVDFNQIAGPNSAPGAMNGVLVARINADVSLADFEIGVRNLVNDTENAYWELYYAYRELDAKKAALDRALETWQNVNALYRTGRQGGEADKEAQAREQYFRLQEEVQNALAGRVQERVRTTIFRGTGGVHAAERRLRLLLGVPINDGRLIRPADEPLMARVVFDWYQALTESMTRRAELRRQKWEIKRAELELCAAKNFLLPRVDAIGRYRFRGLGHDLINSTRQAEFDNAYQELTSGDFQEWQLGVEFRLPVGFRRAHAGVRFAELTVLRQRALLEQQEQEVAHDLSAAIAEVDRAYATAQTNYNRREAARDQLAALESQDTDADQADRNRLLDQLLDAQRRFADADASYYRSLIEYTLAVKNVHFAKGSLLQFNDVFLTEGPWPEEAYHDAMERDANRRDPLPAMSYVFSQAWPITQSD